MQRADAFIASDRWLTWNEPNDAMKPGDPGPGRGVAPRLLPEGRLRERLQAVPALRAGQLPPRVDRGRSPRSARRCRASGARAARGSALSTAGHCRAELVWSITTKRTPNSSRSAAMSLARERRVGRVSGASRAGRRRRVTAQLRERRRLGVGARASTTGSPRTNPRTRPPACGGTPAGSRTPDRSRRARSARCRPAARAARSRAARCSLAGGRAERRGRHAEPAGSSRAARPRPRRRSTTAAGRGVDAARSQRDRRRRDEHRDEHVLDPHRRAQRAEARDREQQPVRQPRHRRAAVLPDEVARDLQRRPEPEDEQAPRP